MGDGSLGKPPSDGGDGEGKEPVGRGDPVNDNLGNDGGEDDGYGRAGDGSEELGKYLN